MVYLAPRLSPVAASGRCLLLDAAALSTPPTCSREVVGAPPPRPNHSASQLWRLVCTAQRHQGGGHGPGDSRGAVHTKCQSEHRDKSQAASPITFTTHFMKTRFPATIEGTTERLLCCTS
jgi:hypothetical protein